MHPPYQPFLFGWPAQDTPWHAPHNWRSTRLSAEVQKGHLRVLAPLTPPGQPTQIPAIKVTDFLSIINHLEPPPQEIHKVTHSVVPFKDRHAPERAEDWWTTDNSKKPRDWEDYLTTSATKRGAGDGATAQVVPLLDEGCEGPLERQNRRRRG